MDAWRRYQVATRLMLIFILCMIILIAPELIGNLLH